MAKLSDLLCMLDQYPADQISWDTDILAYHITSLANAEQIRDEGLIGHESRQSYVRPPCVYFFLDPGSAIDPTNADILLGTDRDYAIITVKIPSRFANHLKFDGLYNVSFESGYSAVMYFGDVPQDWIVGINYA